MSSELKKLAEYLDDGCILRHNLTEGCRCLMCEEFQLVDLDGSIVARDDSLEDLLVKLPERKEGDAAEP